MDEGDWKRLREAARQVRERAHAPYSGFQVGAALLSDGGEIFVGANVENASYGLTICAERNAIAAAVAAGVRHFVGAVVLTDTARPTAPCGACRQVLLEFPPGFEVRCYRLAADSEPLVLPAGELLPNAFGPSNLEG